MPEEQPAVHPSHLPCAPAMAAAGRVAYAQQRRQQPASRQLQPQELQQRVTRRLRSKSPDPRLPSSVLRPASTPGLASAQAEALAARALRHLAAPQPHGERRAGELSKGHRQRQAAEAQFTGQVRSSSVDTERTRKRTMSQEPLTMTPLNAKIRCVAHGPQPGTRVQKDFAASSLQAPAARELPGWPLPPYLRPSSRPVTYACRSHSAPPGARSGLPQPLLPPPPAGWPGSSSRAQLQRGSGGQQSEGVPSASRVQDCLPARAHSRSRSRRASGPTPASGTACHGYTKAGRPCRSSVCLQPKGATFAYCPVHFVRWQRFE